MNFNNKLTAILNETQIDYPIEAAIDEYIDRYNNDILKIYQHLAKDLSEQYYPQLDQLYRKANQETYDNSRGHIEGPQIKDYIYDIDRCLNQWQWPNHTDPHQNAKAIISNLTQLTHDIALGNISNLGDENTWVQLETIINELKNYYTTIHTYLNKL